MQPCTTFSIHYIENKHNHCNQNKKIKKKKEKTIIQFLTNLLFMYNFLKLSKLSKLDRNIETFKLQIHYFCSKKHSSCLNILIFICSSPSV